MKPLSTSSQKVQEVLNTFKLEHQVFELEIPVKTAQQAADAVGCHVAQIAKSLIFMSISGKPVLVIDQDLLEHTSIWAAAGHPNSLFKLNPRDLEHMTGGTVASIREE